MQAFEKQTGNQFPRLMKEKPKPDFFSLSDRILRNVDFSSSAAHHSPWYFF